MKKGIIVVTIAVLIFAALFIIPRYTGPGANTKLNAFAQCIADSGATFYGAWWCEHCKAQKLMFGRSAELLPYVECSGANPQTQLPICTEKDVKSYPTWVFADESRLTGEVPLETLAEKTACQLPAAE